MARSTGYLNVAAVVLVLGCASPGVDDDEIATTESIELAVTQTLRELVATMRTKDTDSILSFYAEEYVGPQGITKPSLRPYFENLAASGALDGIELDLSAMVVSIDTAVTAKPVTFTTGAGKVSYAYELNQEADGRWRIVASELAPTPLEPRARERPPSAILRVTAGAAHGCALRAPDNQLVCWGGDAVGQVSPAPADVDFSDIDAGGLHTCGIRRDDGDLVCWGADTYMTTDVRGKVSDAPEGMAFQEVAGGAEHTCGIRADNQHVYCWGDDSAGRVSGAPQGMAFRSLDVGGSHSCAIRVDNGEVACWGWDESGQVSRAPSGVAFAAVATGWFHTCALRADNGFVECWGDDSGGQVSNAPREVAFASLAAKYSTCGIRRDDGRLLCWGMDYDVFGSYIGVVTNAPEDMAFESVAVGESFACGIRRDDRYLYCWGNDTVGQVSSAP